MKQPASLIAAIIFLVMAGAQLCRFIWEVKVVAGGIEIPVWPSAFAALILVALAVWLLKERSRNNRKYFC
jgi:hypothetical protein